MTAIQMTIDDRLLVVIAGPTAVGKTTLGIQLARQLGTRIISADSRQFYREMKIGTAAPSPEELSTVPHHFVHHLSIHDPYNVSRFESEVLLLLDNLFLQYPVVLMVGGSGLYINAVCHGIDMLPDPDHEIRVRLNMILEKSGIRALQDELQIVDPEYAAVVDLANPARLIRALEIYRATGVPFSTLRTNTMKTRRFRIVKIGIDLPREILNQRINGRVEAMIKDGLVEEARQLYPLRHLNALNTVGYKELFEYFEGNTSLDYAVDKIKTNSRRYAKRQLTWFRKDPDYKWFKPEDAHSILELPELSPFIGL
ncbi:MAG: tRNA (adenosine(37)-N6)-dimethylallyltransferase MiaA [Bacteroidota bacterium]